MYVINQMKPTNEEYLLCYSQLTYYAEQKYNTNIIEHEVMFFKAGQAKGTRTYRMRFSRRSHGVNWGTDLTTKVPLTPITAVSLSE